VARLAYFSPTGTTRQVLEGIARGLEATLAAPLDLTPPEAATQQPTEIGRELVLLGAPVYAGRIPAEAAKRLRLIGGHVTPSLVVVAYGNREYEDALLELRDLAVAQGFNPVAAGAFIGEHSFDSQETPIATGRPDAEDLRKAEEFGKGIQRKLSEHRALGEMEPLRVPGNHPYQQGMEGEATSPAIGAQCTMCGRCAEACPTAAITVGDCALIDRSLCILCSACVKACPVGALVWADDGIRGTALWLSRDFAERKEPETFL
jgi:ferredoxin